jgi:hypothetical protein
MTQEEKQVLLRRANRLIIASWIFFVGMVAFCMVTISGVLNEYSSELGQFMGILSFGLFWISLQNMADDLIKKAARSSSIQN